MPKPSLLNSAIRFATAVALLAAVMTSPIRPAITALARGSYRVDCLRRNFGMPGKAGTAHHRPHAPITSRVVQVKALSSRHEPDWTVGAARHRVAPPHSPHLEAGTHSMVRSFDHTAHPLRC